MPNCVRFINKETSTAIQLNLLDEELCLLVGDEVHPTRWCRNWFDVIGFMAAMGDSYADIRGKFEAGNWGEHAMERFGEMLTHLEEKYDIDAWSTRS